MEHMVQKDTGMDTDMVTDMGMGMVTVTGIQRVITSMTKKNHLGGILRGGLKSNPYRTMIGPMNFVVNIN